MISNFRIAFIFAALLPMAAAAQWWESSFDLDVGYRQDELTCTIDAYNPADNFIYTDDLKLTNLHVYEAGAKGKCIAWDTWLLKSYLYSGFVPHGNYSDTVTLVNGSSSSQKLKVNTGQTVDFALGGGFLFPIYCGVRVGPTGGWSYHHQHIKMGCDRGKYRGLEYKNRWQGAWIGADTFLSFRGFGVNAGYEYHIPHWSGYWLIKKKFVPGGPFSDVRKSKRGWGNVVYFDASTVNFCCIRLNCQLKYQYWKMHDGCAHPKSKSFAAVGLAHQKEKVRRATWQSFEALLGIGLEF